MLEITLLRHGRTTANAGGLLQGHVDNPLDDVGRAQAEAAAASIGPVDRIVSSPLRRATETAAFFDAPVTIDERWVELNYGEWDGRPVADVPAETWAQWRTDLQLRPPGGETLLELSERVRPALVELAAGDGGHLLVVSHVSPIKAAVAWALGVDDHVSWRMHLTTGSWSRITVRGDRPVLASFNTIPGGQ